MRRIHLSLILILAGMVSSGRAADSTGGVVYVIHAVDTECRFLPAYREQISNSVDTSDFFPPGTVAEVMSEQYRQANLDSYGEPIRFSWFQMISEVYFHIPQEPGLVYRFMAQYATPAARYGDDFGLHYHHAGYNDYNHDGDSAWCQLLTLDSSRCPGGTDIGLAEKMIAYLIIEKHFFPSTYRAGWTWENTDLSNWLDDIIPFDFTNSAPAAAELVSDDGYTNVYDWSRAPADWSSYHPARDDYQRPGDLKRTMFRTCVTAGDFDAAFEQVARGDTVMVGYYVHSFTPIGQWSTVPVLQELAVKYPSVKYRFVGAREGARLMLGLTDTTAVGAGLVIMGDTVRLTTDRDLFSFPYGAVKLSTGEYRRVRPISTAPLVIGTSRAWDFDLSGIDYAAFAIGGTDAAGNWFVTPAVQRNPSGQ